MKVGTDGVLLGAWCETTGSRALDIGTGTGVIALMLAQRNAQLNILGVEVDSKAALQAQNNMQQSPWNNRLHCIEADFTRFSKSSCVPFDTVVSNPPFFVDSLKSPIEGRNTARHTNELSFADLLGGVKNVLSEQGIFSLILPYVEGNLFIAMAGQYGLHCTRKTNVFSKKGKRVKRLLLEFQKNPTVLFRENQLCIEVDMQTSVRPQSTFSPEYKALTKDFYLNF